MRTEARSGAYPRLGDDESHFAGSAYLYYLVLRSEAA